VQTAALRYFNKNVNKLTLSEATVIAAITKNPTANNPITHPEENELRRKAVLNNMLRLGYITEKELKEAENDDVYARIKAVNKDIKVRKLIKYSKELKVEKKVREYLEVLI